MKRWKQEEFNRLSGGMDGCMRLPAGDYSDIDFDGMNRVIIAPHSVLGSGCKLGESCEIGDHCEIGDYFSARRGLMIGAHCHFGIAAKIPEGTRIARECAFGNGADVAEKDVEIGDGVEFAGLCRRMFGVPDVGGKRMIKISLMDRRTMYGFMDVNGVIYVHIQDGTMAMDEFLRAVHYIRKRQDLHVAAKYINTAMTLDGVG